MTSAQLDELLAMAGVSTSGVAVTASTAMQVATVYACVRLLADSIAQLPVKLYRRGKGGEKESLSVDPLAAILVHAPNGWMTSFEFRELMMTYLCLRGNFYAYIGRDNRGSVTELLPMPTGTVTVRRNGWMPIYDITLDGKRHTVPAENIFHVRGVSLDGVIGLSPIACQRNAIGLTVAAENHGSRTFRNGARPGGVLIHPGKLSDEALKHLRASWDRTHGGENSGGTAILEEGMSYSPVAMTNEDAQYLEARGFQRTEICSIFRVPPHMIGDLTKSSFSNITQQSLEFVKYTILPWSKRIEAAIHRDLLTDRQRQQGVFVELLVDGLERADIKTRYEAYVHGIANGWMSPNEVRAKENMNPREGGDVYLMPLNMTDGTNPPQAAPVKGIVGPCACGREHKAAADEEFEEQDGEVVFSDEAAWLNAIVDELRPRLDGLLTTMVTRECAMVKAALAEHYLKSMQVDFLIALEAIYAEIAKDLRRGLYPLLRGYANLIGTEAARVVGGGQRMLSEDLNQSVRRYVEIYAEQHTELSVNQLQALVRELREDQVVAVIERRLAEWAATRSGKASMEEAVRFTNQIAREQWASLGVKKLRWVAQGSKSCPFCRKMNGKIVGIEEAFLSSGDVLYANDGKNWMAMKKKVRTPPIHRGCVCAIIPELHTESFDIANEGGKNSGYLNAVRAMGVNQLQKNMDSIEKNLLEHTKKRTAPEKIFPEWGNLSDERKDKLVNIYWPREIRLFAEQLHITRMVYSGLIPGKGGIL